MRWNDLVIAFFQRPLHRLRIAVRGPARAALLAVFLVLVVLLPLWWRTSQWYETQLLLTSRSETAVDVSLLSNALSSVINRRLARLQGLHAFVQSEIQTPGDLDEALAQQRFEIFAADLYAVSRGIRVLAVAPNGVVRYAYPSSGNEDLIGYEPLQDPRERVQADAQRAIETGEIILSGPSQLVQGGLGLSARQAVFQGGAFWGFVDIVLDIPVLLEEAGLLEETGNLELALRDDAGTNFFGSRVVFRSDPVTGPVPLPEGRWELVAIPSAGWQAQVVGPLRLFQGAGLIIIALLAGLTYLSVNRQARLAAAVRERTQALQRDILQRMRVESALREREAQYRGIFEANRDGLFINDLDGRLVDFNPAAARMHGYTPQEFRQLQPQEFIDPDSWHVFEEFIEAVKEGGHFVGRAVDVHKDGSSFPVDVLGTVFTYRGRPHALAVVRDVSLEVQAQQLLEQRVAERTRELSTLLEVSRNVNTTLEIEPLLGLILDQLQAVIDYSGAAVLTLEEGDLVVQAERGPVPLEAVLQHRFARDNALDRQVIGACEPLIIDDVRGDTPQARAFQAAAGDDMTTVYGYIRSWMGVPLVVKETAIGMLALDHREPNAFTARDAELTLAFASQAAVAIENARLYRQAQRLAVLEERQRLARELHDSVSQVLYGIGLNARAAHALLDREPDRALTTLEEVQSLASAGLTEMRALIFELRPDSLEKEGLVAALNRQAAALQARHNLQVVAALGAEPSLPFEAKEALYRIAQEALNNTVKHAQASRVEIRLDTKDGRVVLEVRDDGIGFDPQAEFPGHMGLQSMSERAARLGGTLEIESAQGQGTSLRAKVPAA